MTSRITAKDIEDALEAEALPPDQILEAFKLAAEARGVSCSTDTSAKEGPVCKLKSGIDSDQQLEQPQPQTKSAGPTQETQAA